MNAPKAGVQVPTGGVFRFESELVSVIRPQLPKLVFGGKNTGAIEVFGEVPAAFGVPDLVGIRFDVDALSSRIEAGIRPLTTDAEVRAIFAIGNGCEIRNLHTRLGMSSSYVRRAIVPMLKQLGWVEESEGFLRVHDKALWVGRRVVTVEAKLQDWKQALSQARRQRMSAHAAYIALPEERCGRVISHLDPIKSQGIGVMSVNSETQQVRVLSRPCSSSGVETQVGRALIAERTFDLLIRGKRDGQIYPVFGWTLPDEFAPSSEVSGVVGSQECGGAIQRVDEILTRSNFV